MNDIAADDVALASRLVGRDLRPVGRLPGGEHAVTSLFSDGTNEYVLRRFPSDDPAVSHEIGVLARLTDLGAMAPRLVAYEDDPAAPAIVTTRVAGTPPGTDLSPKVVASAMARALTRIHALDGAGLRRAPADPPPGSSAIAERAGAALLQLDRSELVLTHYDFWCGNTLWCDGVLCGVVDWSGARQAPRGLDVAWARLDLVLLGSVDAADLFLSVYRRVVDRPLADIADWDRIAAAHADVQVESWSPNYAGIGRPDLTPAVLRHRLDAWRAALLSG